MENRRRSDSAALGPTSLLADVMAKSAAKSTHQGENEPILEGQAIKRRY
jgi:hypothetical protein